MTRHRATILTILTLATTIAAAGCSRMLREKRTPYPTAAAHTVPWRMNRDLLVPETTTRILFLVEVTGGKQPRGASLDHLMEIASKYGERPASWVRAGEPGAPDLVEDRFGTLRCPAGPLDPQTSLILIRYVGAGSPGLLGRTTIRSLGRECGRDEIFSIQIAQDTLARQRFLWLTRDRLEEYDLVHEYGHVLGLGSNPGHGFYPGYPDFSSGDHCINPDCALAGPHPRANFYRIYRTGLTFRHNRDFCRDCRRDILWSKTYWRMGKSYPESPRIPAPDLSEWIANLENEDFQEGGKAIVLLYHGKDVMPALIKRMHSLPSEGDESPRATADWITKAIVMQEALKRAGKGFTADWMMGDSSREMLWWWMKEGRRFMEGEDWELPPPVLLIPNENPSKGRTDPPAAASPAAPSFMGPTQD